MKKGINKKKGEQSPNGKDGGAAPEQQPFVMLGERLEGDLAAPPADLPEPGPTEPAAPKRTRKKKGDVSEVAEPDQELIDTMKFGTDAMADVLVKMAKFSEPGDKWREGMARLSARWMLKFEDSWIATHPVEGALILHLGFWIGPNVIMRAVEYAEQAARRKRENLDRGRTTQERKDDRDDKKTQLM